jgi:hypothetical protein
LVEYFTLLTWGKFLVEYFTTVGKFLVEYFTPLTSEEQQIVTALDEDAADVWATAREEAI